MSLTTRYPGQIFIADSPENIVFGTVMLGNLYGEVISATVTREGDIEELEAAGSILACIISNPNFQFKFETMFRLDVIPPGFADLITFPLAGIKGRVLPPIGIKWEQKGHRGLTIEAKSWDKFADTNQGGGNASIFDGITYTPIVDP
jgi:hypothetical protein